MQLNGEWGAEMMGTIEQGVPETATGHGGALPMRIVAIERIAENVVRLEMEPRQGTALPRAEAGAHIDLQLPNGMVRQYSLVNEGESHRYIVAVSRDTNSRGGSEFIHDVLRIGDPVAVGNPRNNFRLDESASPAVLISGGIGITPLWPMIRQLERRERQWTLYYCARTERHAAFFHDIQQFAMSSRYGTLNYIFDGEPGQKPVDFHEVVARHSNESHFYCCGPQGMLRAFEDACQKIDPDQVHVEYFKTDAIDTLTDHAFEIELLHSGQRYEVPGGKSILDVLIERGENVMYSCKEGICGTCETVVLEGEPLHRDVVLTGAERAKNRSMMICVSRCKGKRLKLDL
jgi:tetrachlorobenzoquinone reductase